MTDGAECTLHRKEGKLVQFSFPWVALESIPPTTEQ